MSLQTNINQMALQQRVYDLLQATQRLQLEKEEYLKEVARLKYGNTELQEKLSLLQTVTIDSTQQAKLLSHQLSTHSIELNAENIENTQLKNKLKQNIKRTNKIRKENESLKQTNKRLQNELEKMNMKYKHTNNDLNDTNLQIEAYKTKIMQLENGTDLLQQQIINFASEYSVNSLSDSEEKSVENPMPNIHQREKTLDLKLTAFFNSAAAQKQGVSRGSTKKLFQNLPISALKDNITIYDDYDYEDAFDIDGAAQIFNASNSSIDRRSVVSYTQSMFGLGSPVSTAKDYELYDENGEDECGKLKYKILELQEVIHREKVGNDIKIKVLKEKNESWKEQLGEKDEIIKKCTRQNYELSEQFNFERNKLSADWKAEKDEIVRFYEQKSEEIVLKKHEEIRRLNEEKDKYYNQWKGNEGKLNRKRKEIKRLKSKNKEMQMIVTAPPASTTRCYSVVDWFKL